MLVREVLSILPRRPDMDPLVGGKLGERAGMSGDFADKSGDLPS
jgi:hypothetical protein